jgi:hypothetical protein
MTSSYIINHDVTIKGDLTVKGSIINVMSQSAFDKLDTTNLQPLCSISDGNVVIENDLIIICYDIDGFYDMHNIIVEGSIITMNNINMD